MVIYITLFLENVMIGLYQNYRRIEMKNKIKLYIVSGFLGSGKTTFLKRLLENFSGKKLGVLINEFGVIGIDGRTINKEGLEYVEVNNGSIFCSCIKADFVKTLIELQKLDIDMLLIENSGLADPSSMNTILDEMASHMERGYDYIGSVCIIDSSRFLKYVDMLPQLSNQVSSSEFIILNKTDLTDEATISDLRKRMNTINPNAFVIKAEHTDVPLMLLDSQLKNNGVFAESYNTPSNRVATYTIKLDKQYRKTGIESFVRGLEEYAMRIKGFVDTDEGWLHVDIIDGDYYNRIITSVDDELIAKQSIVIISKNHVDFDDKVSALWQEQFKELPKFIEE